MRMRVVGAAVTLSALMLSGAGAAQAGSASAPRPGPQARVWVTTPDRAELLHERAPVSFSRGGSDQVTITVDPDTTYQRMDGFGASITDSSANVLYQLPAAQREKAMRSLFMANDPAVKHHNLVREYEHPELGRLRMLGQPVSFSETPVRDPGRPPTLGEHTDAILRELGYDDDAVADLRTKGVLRTP